MNHWPDALLDSDDNFSAGKYIVTYDKQTQRAYPEMQQLKATRSN